MMFNSSFRRMALAIAFQIAAVSAALIAQARATDLPRFNYVRYEAVADPAAPAGYFRNPVLSGFQPDPSMIRVGDDFYLANSTFAWFPGVPIYHSRDLLNWRLIGHAIKGQKSFDFSKLGTTRAIFAPALAYHNRTFYLLGTCIECGGNFILTAPNAAGPWSEPHWLGFEGIDPSLFIDVDGKAYVVNNGEPAIPAEYQGHRAIWIQNIDLGTFKMHGPRQVLRDKGVDPAARPIWIEGPHIFRKHGYYYLSAAEGGTADQHAQTIYRSSSLLGPYVPGPINPILTQRDLPASRQDPVQATGHAAMVELGDGHWWAVFLATRPYEGQKTNLGRETFLLPVTWKDQWPQILPPGTPIPSVIAKPALPAQRAVVRHRWEDRFKASKLDDEWLMLRTPPKASFYKLSRRSGLELTPGRDATGSLGQIAFLGRRLRHHAATVETRLHWAASSTHRAGLLAFTDESHFLFLAVEPTKQDSFVVTVRRRSASTDSEDGVILHQSAQTVRPDQAVDLRIRLDHGKASFGWRQGGRWQILADQVDASILATINAGLFTGVVIGPHAVQLERQ
jgi:xylan 1,4-beta-xylosidase